MLKAALTALAAMPLMAASAHALDNAGPARAAAAFDCCGVQGMALAGRSNEPLPPPVEIEPSAVPYGYATIIDYAPRRACRTEYLTAETGNTLVTIPTTICR